MKSFILAYDISDNKDRYKISKELFKYGIRTQKSFFELNLSDKELRELKNFFIQFNQDSNKINLYQVFDFDTKRLGNSDYLIIDDFIL